MTGDVGERQVARTQQLDGRALEQSKVLLAHVARVLNRLVANVVDVGACTNYADIVRVRLQRVERDI